MLLLSLSFAAPASPKVNRDCDDLDDVVEHGGRRGRAEDGSARRGRIRSSRIPALVGRHLREGYTIEFGARKKMDLQGIKTEEVESFLEGATFRRDERDIYSAQGRLPDGLNIAATIFLDDRMMSVTKIHLQGSRWEVYHRMVGYIDEGSVAISGDVGRWMRGHGVEVRDILSMLKNSPVKTKRGEDAYIIWGKMADGQDVRIGIRLGRGVLNIASIATAV